MQEKFKQSSWLPDFQIPFSVSLLSQFFLLFAVEIVGLFSFHDYFFQPLFYHRPFAAVGIKTGISGTSTARIIGNDVVNKIVVASVGELMRFTGLKQKRIASGYDCRSILVANAPATGNDEIKFRLRGVRVVRAIRFALWNSDQREIKRMPFRQIERLRFATECNGHILHELVELALWRFSFLFRNVFQIHFAHIHSPSFYFSIILRYSPKSLCALADEKSRRVFTSTIG